MFNIRQIKVPELPDFFELFQHTISESFPEWNEISKQTWLSDYYSPELWLKLLNQEKMPIFVAFAPDNKMIGFVAIEHITFGVAYLSWIAVLSNFQNQGIGGQLIKVVENWCLAQPKLHKIELETQLPSLESFYLQHGYILEGTRKNSWQHLSNYLFGKVLR